jgi:hypothetical protein
VSTRCCRSTPRCGDCPVRLKAAAVRRAAAAGAPAAATNPTAVLVAEVLAGASPRGLPPCVAGALAQLDEARARRPVPPLFDGTVRNLL